MVSSLYPSERTEIITINGFYDPFDDQTFSQAIWEISCSRHWTTYHVAAEIIAAPALTNKYAIHLKGMLGNVITGAEVMAMSAYRNYGNNQFYSYLNPLRFKLIQEFRLRIVSDQTGTTVLSHGAGWCLDGNVQHYEASGYNNRTRSHVIFHVGSQKAGICVQNFSDEGTGNVWAEVIHSVDWAGSYDTWYNIRIITEYDWLNDPDEIIISVYVNKSLLFSHSMSKDYWRTYRWTGLSQTSSGSYYEAPWNAILGRCGPGLICENDGGTNGTYVEAYWTDIHVSLDHNIIRWEYEDSILQGGFFQAAMGMIITAEPLSFAEGADIQIWKRNSTADLFKGHFRGILRKISRPLPKVVKWEAEGAGSVFYAEKTDELSFTSQTAGTIVAAAINNPQKNEFDTTTYFDSTTATYTKTYTATPKLQIIEEMAKNEGFIVFLDVGNNVHFQSHRSNPLAKHLIYGQSRIRAYSTEDVFARQPNIIRVIGSGVYAEREVSTLIYISNSRIIRQINRLELTTQAEVDAEADYYVQALMEPILRLTLEMRPDWEITKGSLIAVTIPDINLSNRRFLVTAIMFDGSVMKLNLLEAKVHLPTLLSDLVKRTDGSETVHTPIDAITDTGQFNVEGGATMIVDAEYEIEYNSSIVRSGKMTVTDDLIDDLLAVWNEETITPPSYVAYGTGTTPPLWNDTALETESSRASASKVYAEKTCSAYQDATWYRAIEYSINVSSPSGITELGLLNAPSAGTLACRATFGSYSQAGTVTFRIRIRLLPKPNTTFVTVAGLMQTLIWFSTGTNLAINYICHAGSYGFCSPHPDLCGASEIYGALTWVPDSVTKGTFSMTKYIERNQIKYTFIYNNYDRATDFGGVGYNNFEFAIALKISGSANQDFGIINFRRGNQYLDTVADGKDCRWTLWLKFEQGGAF